MREKIIDALTAMYVSGMHEGAKIAMNKPHAGEMQVINHILDLVDGFIYGPDEPKLSLVKPPKKED